MRLTRVTGDHRNDQVRETHVNDNTHGRELLKFDDGGFLRVYSGQWKCALHV